MSDMLLPRALQGWGPWLSWFPSELAAELGALLLRMHPLLGRFHGQRLAGVDEPDGISDLRRRGSYDRLLSTEWLMADELPDEFLRRAAQGEHLFLAPRPRSRSADKLIVALFDTGPWQLGAPRLAQMALWILLARRAAEVGGALRWGTWQKPGEWHTAESANDLRRFLQARSVDLAGAAELTRWSDWLEKNAEGLGECWLAGHDMARAAAATPSAGKAPTHTVQLRRALAGDALQVVLRAGSAVRTMELPLPPQAAGVALLNARFDGAVARPVAVDAAASTAPEDKLSLRYAPIIAEQGHRVAVPLLNERGVMMFNVDRVIRHQGPRSHRQKLNKDKALLGAAFAGKGFAGLLATAGSLQFWQMAGMGRQPRPPRERFEAAPGRGKLLPMAWGRADGHRPRAYVIDAAARLVSWTASGDKSSRSRPVGEPEPSRFSVIDEHVVAMALVDSGMLIYLNRYAGRTWVRFLDSPSQPSPPSAIDLAFDPGPHTHAFIAHPVHRLAAQPGVALRVSHTEHVETWRVYESLAARGEQPAPWEARLPPTARACGLVTLPGGSERVLVVLSANRRVLALHHPTAGGHKIWEAPMSIERVSVCSQSGLIALLTSDRGLHVYSLNDKRMRWDESARPGQASVPAPAGQGVDEDRDGGGP